MFGHCFRMTYHVATFKIQRDINLPLMISHCLHSLYTHYNKVSTHHFIHYCAQRIVHTLCSEKGKGEQIERWILFQTCDHGAHKGNDGHKTPDQFGFDSLHGERQHNKLKRGANGIDERIQLKRKRCECLSKRRCHTNVPHLFTSQRTLPVNAARAMSSNIVDFSLVTKQTLRMVDRL